MLEALLSWYRRERRDLPWRRTRDPYAILVSEVMLQQTQVARVVPRYQAWLARWPTAAALAAAPLADVLREWVGLGYNRRAVRLWEAAGIVARDGWPERLEDLPGVGPYTAAAVGSFAFDRQELAIDTNARRVFARLGAVLAPPPGRAAELNQATMELGATVCTARAPRCDACPLAAGCAGPQPAPARRGARERSSASRTRMQYLHYSVWSALPPRGRSGPQRRLRARGNGHPSRPDAREPPRQRASGGAGAGVVSLPGVRLAP